jgi:hypothetical protein
MLLAWVVYPLVLLALCGGLGLLLDALCGRRLPGALVAPAGFAALIVIAQAMTIAEATAPYAASLAILLAGVGVVASMPWRFGRPDPWAIAVAFAAFLFFAGPVVLSGEPTFTAYGTLGDTPTWLAIAERAMEHGRDLGGLAPSTYQVNLEETLGSGDPIGAVLPLAAVQRLLGGEVAWHFQPYLAVLGALLTLCAWQITAADFDHTRVGSKSAGPLDPRPRALLAFLAAVPALVFGYAGWVGVQELTAATLIVLAVALALQLRHGETHSTGNSRRMRFTVWAPVAIAAAALFAVLAPRAWPFPLDTDAWLATAALTAFIAATVALGLWVASVRRPAALLAFGVALVACAAVASAGASLASYEGLTELRQINERFAEEGPALVFERTPYGSHYSLRDIPPDEVTDPAGEEIPLSATARGREPGDTDQIDFRALLAYPLLILPRSPGQSPPASSLQTCMAGRGLRGLATAADRDLSVALPYAARWPRRSRGPAQMLGGSRARPAGTL